MLKFGLEIGECGGLPSNSVLTPAGPAAITSYTLVPGASDGTLTYTITGAPSAGDGAVAGDALGTITGYQWRPTDYPVWFPLTGLGPHTLQSPLLPGESLTLQIRALGYQGRSGAITTTAAVTVTGAAVDIIYVVDADLNAVFSSSDKRVVTLVPSV